MSEYLTQLRDRSGSRQERLNQSLKGSRLDARPLTQLKSFIKTDRGHVSSLLKYQSQQKELMQQPLLSKYNQVSEALQQLSGKPHREHRDLSADFVQSKKKKKRQQSVKSLYNQRGHSPSNTYGASKRSESLLGHHKKLNNHSNHH